MGKTKNAAPNPNPNPTEARRSSRIKNLKTAPVMEIKRKPATKKAPKAKKAKPAENGSAKAEEPKAEATEAK